MKSLIWLVSLMAGVTVASSCWRNSTCDGPSKPSFPGPWESNIYSPRSRVINPKAVISVSDGSQISGYQHDSSLLLDASNPLIVVDFGVEVGGVIAFDYKLTKANTTTTTTVGLAFTEAKDFIGRRGDNSLGSSRGDPGDGPLLVNLTSNDANGHYLLPDKSMRGGFRYFTLFLDSPSCNTHLQISNITVEISFQPTWPNLQAYGGYFHSDDELLNRIWYSGAYTVQTNSVPGNTGRNNADASPSDWRNDAFITNGETVLLDGAKRDRWVWIGDMGTAVPSAFVSTGDLESSKYALLSIYDNQNAEGILPKAGPPYVRWDSDTYHMWALIGTYNYLLYSGDEDFIRNNWAKHEAAVAYAWSLLNEVGVVDVQGNRDWGRLTSATDRSSASMLLYRALVNAASITSWIPDLPTTGGGNETEEYLSKAKTLRASILEQFWDEEVGAFRESPQVNDLHPQDANSFALAYGVVESDSEEASRITDYLAEQWGPFGPSSPELPENVSPFITSVELEAHFRAGRPDRSLELMRTLWGWYLNHENGTQSTTPEGFLQDGTWGYRYNGGYYNAPSYMSHAHCWSSGPTSTLSEHMLGLRLTKPGGREWLLKPASFMELATVQAGYTTSLGKFSAKFEINGDEAIIEWDTPVGSRGVVQLPGSAPEEVEGGSGSRVVSIS